jgi:sugar/nucleoside kinase (ribokinase family)
VSAADGEAQLIRGAGSEGPLVEKTRGELIVLRGRAPIGIGRIEEYAQASIVRGRRQPGPRDCDEGCGGSVLHRCDGSAETSARLPATSVDTTGAGDTFNGALGAFWDQGLAEAVRRGCAAGALSVTRRGAQDSMPALTELNAFLDSGR